jgi:RNA polymerase sigma-70 factor (ECF subfamily)
MGHAPMDGLRSLERQRTARFEAQILAHLDSAYRLARFLLRDAAVAKDAVQDACLRAFNAFDQMQGPDARLWFLAVVRNVCMDHLRERRHRAHDEEYDDDQHGGAVGSGLVPPATPEELAILGSDARWLREAIEKLPKDYREVIVLRELEELSYKEISAIVDIPIGTVMSRLARARDLLQSRARGVSKEQRR